MRTRNHDWFDTKRLKPVFSVQVYANGRWCHVHDNGKPCFFDDAEKRDALRAELRKMKETPR